MKNDEIESKWKKLPDKVRRWWKKRGEDQRTIANEKREKSIGILQKRYGYTKEKATAELDEYYPKAKLC